jgi:hypothetical protein
MSIITKTIHEDRTCDSITWKYWYSLYDMSVENIRDIMFKDERILQANQAYDKFLKTQVHFILSNTNIPLKNKAK